MDSSSIASFPDDVPLQPLVVIDYQLLLDRDVTEINRIWTAAINLGFWYLQNHGMDTLFDLMFEMGASTMSLPLDQKMNFWQGDDGGYFGYKASGATTVDRFGSKDCAEFINIAKDDALAFPAIVHRTYPAPVNERMETVVKPFVAASVSISRTILSIFNDKLNLPPGTLYALHSLEESSVSEARCIKVPPTPMSTKIAIGAHTDFGSLSILYNKLGGLQILLPGEVTWKYVKPLPGHVICNIGDTLNLLSGGILKSSLHRVLPPPGMQSYHERWSLVFFTRPGNSVYLRALHRESTLIANAVDGADRDIFDSGVTAAQWFARRQSKWRVKNQKGLDDYLASRGTEHIRDAV